MQTFGSLGAALAALVLALAAPLAWAQGAAKNAVESINFSQAQGGKILVKIGLTEPRATVPPRLPSLRRASRSTSRTRERPEPTQSTASEAT
jgi:hypothetical protein